MELKIDLELEKKEIIKRYRKLLKAAKPFLKDKDAKLIKKAFQISADAHKDMRRKSGEPYIYHPLEVAQICVEEIGLGTTSIIAALLHDVVEDTDIELSEIEKDFGKKVATIIDGLTKISGVVLADPNNSMQAENFRKILLTLSDDVRVILIKIADRLHNMRTLESMPRSKQLKIASETSYIYAPLAHRLGLYAIKSELEDLYLKYTDRETYDEIADKIKATKAARDKFIKDFIAPLNKTLTEEGLNFVLKGRPKSIHSIYTKIKKQNIPFEKIYDLFAIRIILEDVSVEQEKAACWKVYSIVTDYYKPSPERLRDWISTPRANGYESLHTTVMSSVGQWVEVQIRTRKMDDIAEKGYAAHWKYKESEPNTKTTTKISAESHLESWLNKVRDMLERQDTTAIEFVDEFRSNLFSDEVFAFTPKGDLKVLAAGATALDFAFEIHSNLGASCIGAKINGKLQPISYKLQNGDQVEIATSKKQTPSEDWLRFVVSSKAKTRIREYLNDDKRSMMKKGREIVDKKIMQMLSIPTDDNILNELRALFNYKSSTDFLYSVGKDYIKPAELKKYKIVYNKKVGSKHHIKDDKSFAKAMKAMQGEDAKDILLIGEDLDTIDYQLAVCCNPISGDDVFGYVTVNDGIKIHRTSCKNAKELLSQHGNRVLKAQWTSITQKSFLVDLTTTGLDRVGLVNDVTRVISSELKVNMHSISLKADKGIFYGNFTVLVHDLAHLNILMEKLREIDGVEDVVRYENHSEV